MDELKVSGEEEGDGEAGSFGTELVTAELSRR